jgi:hypothetical protein
MSALFLEGKLFLKTKDLPSKKELTELFASDSILEFDKKLKENIEKKFNSREERIKFVENDILYHLDVIRRETEEKLRHFFQFLFLPFDLFRIFSIFSKIDSKFQLGYFKEEEIERILKNKIFPKTMIEPIRKIFEKVGKVNGELIIKEAHKEQIKFFKSLNLKNITLYFQLLEIDEKNLVKTINKFFVRIPSFSNFYSIETFRFYLPFFLKSHISYFENELEFLFFYFKERYVLWKILEKNIV